MLKDGMSLEVILLVIISKLKILYLGITATPRRQVCHTATG